MPITPYGYLGTPAIGQPGVGFIRGLLVVGGNEAGGWDLVGPNGRHYHFTPHLGLVRLGDVL
jgi:hypothetical protein